MIYFEDDYVGEEYNLQHPRILWNNICRRGTVTGSTEATGFEAVNAATATTFDAWKPTAMPATWKLEFDDTEAINAIGIDTHNLGTSGTTVTVQAFDDGDWEDVVSGTPTDDEPIAFLFEARSENRIRLSLAGSTEPEISVIHCSYALEVPQMVYMGATTPIDLAFTTEFEFNQSADGHFLGQTEMYRKNDNEFSIQHLTEYWMRNTMLPFIKDAREYPYFLLERPHSLPTALSYRIRTGRDLRPERMGIKSLMQITL